MDSGGRRMIKGQVKWLGVMLVVALALTSAAHAQGGYGNGHDNHESHDGHDGHGGGHWVYLGNRHVDGKADRDNIEIKPGDKFRAIQFRVDGGLVQFTRVIVHFRNGSREELDVRANIPSGGRSGVIDLPGQRRSIQSVEMWYNKANWRTRPTINLFGMM
jgi:hypothetical protein